METLFARASALREIIEFFTPYPKLSAKDVSTGVNKIVSLEKLEKELTFLQGLWKAK